VRYYGNIRKYTEKGQEYSVWENGHIVIARAYDNMIPGYNTFNTNNLRLWKSLPRNEFDFT